MLRFLKQPGPALEPRIESFAGRGQVLDYVLQPGLSFNAALTGPLVAAGMTAAAMRFEGGGLGPFAYVIPHPSPDADHVAYFSPPRSTPGISRIEVAQATFGFRDGAPFLHCHATWLEPDGAPRGGHILPHETIVAEATSVRAWGLRHVSILADPDPETGFPLFHPALNGGAEGGGPRLIVARIKPNEEIHQAIEALCRRHAVREAILRGSVGSLHAPRFADGRVLDDVATEVFAAHGVVRPGADGAPRAELDMCVVDMQGQVHCGKLQRDENPVCVTFELLLEAVA